MNIKSTEHARFQYFKERMSWTLTRMARYVAQSKYLQQLKENDEACTKAFDTASFLLFLKGKPLLGNNPNFSILWKPFKEAEVACQTVKTSSVLLNIDDETEDKALFACPVDPDNVDLISTLKFSDVRSALIRLDAKEAGMVSRGYSLLKWHETFKYCPSCTSPLTRNVSGTFQLCSKPCNPAKIHHYPQTCPVAITRVTDPANERVILVRQPRHPRGMYSCIAGFIEPGENLENTVRREIAEEVGVVVDQIKYFGSQTWGLPQDSLMLGCCAIAAPGSENLDMDKGELESAKWFTKDEVKAAFIRVKENPSLLVHNENGDLIIPPSGAIAYHLLKDWIS